MAGTSSRGAIWCGRHATRSAACSSARTYHPPSTVQRSIDLNLPVALRSSLHARQAQGASASRQPRRRSRRRLAAGRASSCSWQGLGQPRCGGSGHGWGLRAPARLPNRLLIALSGCRFFTHRQPAACRHIGRGCPCIRSPGGSSVPCLFLLLLLLLLFLLLLLLLLPQKLCWCCRGCSCLACCRRLTRRRRRGRGRRRGRRCLCC